MLLDMHPCLVHSLAVVEVILVLVAVGTVAVLEVVNVKVPPVLEGVVAKVASTSIAVISDTRSKCGRRYRSPPCSLLARTWRG